MSFVRVLFGLVLMGLAACAPASAPEGLAPQAVRIPVVADGKTIELEGFVYRPNRAGRHPVVVFNHGSAGGEPKAAQRAETQAAYFASRGFLVVVPMRRGRGQSEGVSLEGEEKSCDVESWEPGLQAASDDLTAAIDLAATLSDADTSRIVMAGASRGGFLSAAYAATGKHRDAVIGVVNFSGGWVAQAEDDCPVDFNLVGFQSFAKRSSPPQLWLYGENDPYYERDSILSYVKVFSEAGAPVQFELISGVPGNGHLLANHPELWRDPVDAFLASMETGSNPP